MAEEIKNPNTEEEYQPDLMTLEDEDGNEVTFEVIDALDHKGVHYLAAVSYTHLGIERPDFSGKRGVLPAVHGEQQRAVEADALGGVFPLLLLDFYSRGNISTIIPLFASNG